MFCKRLNHLKTFLMFTGIRESVTVCLHVCYLSICLFVCLHVCFSVGFYKYYFLALDDKNENMAFGPGENPSTKKKKKKKKKKKPNNLTF